MVRDQAPRWDLVGGGVGCVEGGDGGSGKGKG